MPLLAAIAAGLAAAAGIAAFLLAPAADGAEPAAPEGGQEAPRA